MNAPELLGQIGSLISQITAERDDARAEVEKLRLVIETMEQARNKKQKELMRFKIIMSVWQYQLEHSVDPNVNDNFEPSLPYKSFCAMALEYADTLSSDTQYRELCQYANKILKEGDRIRQQKEEARHFKIPLINIGSAGDVVENGGIKTVNNT